MSYTTSPMTLRRILDVLGRQMVVCVYIALLATAGEYVATYFGPFWGAALGYYVVFWILMDRSMGDRSGMWSE